MDTDGEISLFVSYKCEENCPNQSHAFSRNLDLECNHVCYDGCEAICTDDYDPIFQFEVQIEGILFSIGNTISMVGLLITFLTFCTFKKLRNVTGRCVMNLVASLFLAKLSFQINPSFTNIGHRWCSLMAMGQHYFCLCAFHWTSVLAYDLYITVKRGRRNEGTKKTRKNKDKHPTFLSYFVFAWGFPLSAIVACITVESLTHYEFHYGNHEHCGVFGDEILLYSLAIPLLVITLLNTCLYIVIVCHPGLSRQISMLHAHKYSLKDNRYLQQIKSAAIRKDVAGRSSNTSQRHCVIHQLPTINENHQEQSPRTEEHQERMNVNIEYDQRRNNQQTSVNVDEINVEQTETTYERQVETAHDEAEEGSVNTQATARNSDVAVTITSTTTIKAETNSDPMMLYKAEMHEITLLKIYVNMSCLMALAWLCGFLAAMIHFYEIWIFFMIWNMLQGIFIFKSFVMQVGIRKMWANHIRRVLEGNEEDKSAELQQQDVEKKPKWKFLSRNLPKRIIGSWQNNAPSTKEDKQPLHINHIDL